MHERPGRGEREPIRPGRGEPPGPRPRPEPPILDVSGTPTDRIKGRLVQWLKMHVDSPETEQPLVLTVAQMAKYGGNKTVGNGEIVFDWSRETVEDCAHDIVMAAIEDMESGNFTSDVAYCVTVEGRDGRHNFTLKTATRDGQGGRRQREFPPDMEGLMAQMMDTNLQLTDKVVTTASAQTDMLLRTIAERDEEIRHLKRREYQLGDLIRKMQNGDVERRIMIEEHEAKMEQSAKVADGIKAAIPGLVALLGGPQAAAAIALLMPQGGVGAAGEEGSPSALALAGFEGPPDLRLLDEFVLFLEKETQVRGAIFEALAKHTDALRVLGELYRLSSARREARAQAQAEAAEEKR